MVTNSFVSGLRMQYILLPLFLIFLISACRNTPVEKHVKVEHSSVYSDYGPYMFPTKYPDHVILNLTEDPVHSVAVNWRTDTTVTAGTIEVAVSEGGPSFLENRRVIPAVSQSFSNSYESEPEVKSHYHHGIIDNLQPGMKYVYRVGIDTVWSEWYQFSTPNPESEPLTFIYFGDAQNEVKSLWSRVIREAYSTLPDIDFMLHAGDLINRSARDLEWGEWFYAGGFIHATVPSIMTPGNHEYKNVVLSPQWKPQFNLPSNGPTGLEETCYQVNYPDLKIISLDAEQIDESEKYRDAQAAWLDSILTNDPVKWTMITLHYPFYSTKSNRDNPELREHFKPILDKHRVDIVLQGHDHAYGRGMIENTGTGVNARAGSSGTMYVVSVSGPKMYDIGDKAWMQRRAYNTQLFQIISLDGDTLEYKAFTASGDLYDAFDLVKSGNGPNQLIDKTPDFPERIQ